jgi:hypothetical protein
MNKYLLSFTLSFLGLTFSAGAMDGRSSSVVPVPSSSVSPQCAEFWFFTKEIIARGIDIWVVYNQGDTQGLFVYQVELCISGNSIGQCRIGNDSKDWVTLKMINDDYQGDAKKMLLGLRDFFYKHNKLLLHSTIETLEAAVLERWKLEEADQLANLKRGIIQAIRL